MGQFYMSWALNQREKKSYCQKIVYRTQNVKWTISEKKLQEFFLHFPFVSKKKIQPVKVVGYQNDFVQSVIL